MDVTFLTALPKLEANTALQAAWILVAEKAYQWAAVRSARSLKGLPKLFLRIYVTRFPVQELWIGPHSQDLDRTLDRIKFRRY